MIPSTIETQKDGWKDGTGWDVYIVYSSFSKEENAFSNNELWIFHTPRRRKHHLSSKKVTQAELQASEKARERERVNKVIG